MIYGIAYWGFGFLRMSTAGLAAQSDGAGAEAEVQAHILRAIPIGLAIGLLVFALQIPLLNGAFAIFTASAEIEGRATDYIRARLWGLPASSALSPSWGGSLGLAVQGWRSGCKLY